MWDLDWSHTSGLRTGTPESQDVLTCSFVFVWRLVFSPFLSLLLVVRLGSIDIVFLCQHGTSSVTLSEWGALIILPRHISQVTAERHMLLLSYQRSCCPVSAAFSHHHLISSSLRSISFSLENVLISGFQPSLIESDVRYLRLALWVPFIMCTISAR